MTDKEQRIIVAERMENLRSRKHSTAEALAFFNDAITLMELVLKEREEV